MKILKIAAMVAITILMLSFTTSRKEVVEQGNGNGTHTHSPASEVQENVVPPTCTSSGQYDAVVYCSECNEELSRTTRTIDNNGHISIEIFRENEVAATCMNNGSYEEVSKCAACGEEISRTTHIIENDNHVSVETVRENEVAATCLSEGSYEEVSKCTACGEVFSRTSVVVERVDHSPAEAVSENTLLPACKVSGSYDSVVKCIWCSTELTRERVVVPAKGHSWSANKCKNCGVAYSIAESLDMTLSPGGDYYIITGIGSCVDTELTLPSVYNGLPVKEIANYAFQDCTNITYAFIPKSITRMGYGAAMGCTGLKKLVLEDTMGWELMEGHDDTEGLPIPFFMLFDTSFYLEKLIDGDFFWLIKK